MTSEEISILGKIADVHNDYLLLPPQHQYDLPEWISAIHQLQRIIATRQARMDHPEIFYMGKKQTH